MHVYRSGCGSVALKTSHLVLYKAAKIQDKTFIFGEMICVFHNVISNIILKCGNTQLGYVRHPLGVRRNQTMITRKVVKIRKTFVF